MDKKEAETSRTTQVSTQSSGAVKRGKPTGAGLIKAKRRLDEVLAELQGCPQLQSDAAALREKVLNTFVEQERGRA